MQKNNQTKKLLLNQQCWLLLLIKDHKNTQKFKELYLCLSIYNCSDCLTHSVLHDRLKPAFRFMARANAGVSSGQVTR